MLKSRPCLVPFGRIWKTYVLPKTLKTKNSTVGRYIRYRDNGRRPDYSAFIAYSNEDFLQVQGDMVLAMPADLNPKSAMAQAILREYDKERIFELRPKVGSVNSCGCQHHGTFWSKSLITYSDKFPVTSSLGRRSLFYFAGTSPTILG